MYREFAANAANITPNLKDIRNAVNNALATPDNVLTTFGNRGVKYVR